MRLVRQPGALSVGILIACAAAACSDSADPAPGPGPSAGCALTLQLSQSFVDLGATQQILLTVTAPQDCHWRVMAPEWVLPLSQYSGPGTYDGIGTGTGSGTVTFRLPVKPATAPRQSSISVSLANSTSPVSWVYLYQEDGCSVRLSPSAVTFDAGGGRKPVTLITMPSCEWSFDAPAWIRVEPASGTGSATLTIDVAAADSSRAGLISTAGLSLGVLQTPVGMSPVLAFSSLSCKALRPGERMTGLCYFEVAPATNPTSSQVSLAVDLRALEWGDNYLLSPDMGTFGLGFFVDVRVGASVVPGVKAIPLTARDGQGRTASATATVTILPPR